MIKICFRDCNSIYAILLTALGETKTSFIEFPIDAKRNDAEKALYNYFYTRFVHKLIIGIIFICILAIIGFSAATPSIKITINLKMLSLDLESQKKL